MSAVVQPTAVSLVDQLGERKCFILARLVPHDGIVDKVPTSPHDGRTNIDPYDSANHMIGAEAQAWAQLYGTGYGVGLVLGEPSGCWCIDLDHCREGYGWLPHASAVIARFSGAYVEVSQSYIGIHIIASARSIQPHGTRCKALRAEVYSKLRFIYLTGFGAYGSALSDQTEALAQFLTAYFPPKSDREGEWTTTPVEQWHGPANDDELIARMLRSGSAASRFGGKIRVSDLWNAEPGALARHYPPQSAGKDYDASAADQALANLCAFWAGNNAERMLALMNRSRLVRDKWLREDYIRGTILRACADQTEWSTGRHVASVDVPTGTAVPGAVPAAPSDAVPTTPGYAYVMTYNSKNQYEATIQNLTWMLGKQEQTRIGFDEFRGRIMIAPTGTEDWRPLTDTDMIQLRETLARDPGFAPVSKELMADVLQLVAKRHSFDSAITWLNGLVWDGVPRVEHFLATYCGAVDDEYTRAVSMYIWTGLANRVLVPACQLDMVVALQSPQGKQKSTGLQAMTPVDECFTDGLSLHQDDDNFKRLIKGKLVVEISELAGLSKADIGVVKRTVTRHTEEWIEKWQTQPISYKRRCMLFATTNEEKFLPPDETGQRRWLPVEVIRIDRNRIAADRSQLWAEGAAIWKARGQMWADAERLAAERHQKYEQSEVWAPEIEYWLNTPEGFGAPGVAQKPRPCERPLTISDVLAGALRLAPKDMNSANEKRVGRVLRQLGYEPRIVRIAGQEKPMRRWVRKAKHL